MLSVVAEKIDAKRKKGRERERDKDEKNFE